VGSRGEAFGPQKEGRGFESRQVHNTFFLETREEDNLLQVLIRNAYNLYALNS
jgi:hypothetical protein